MEQSVLRAKLGMVLNEANSRTNPLAFKVQGFLFFLIIASSLNLILETVPELASWRPAFFTIEVVIMVLFTIEYFCRLWCYRSLNGGIGGVRGFFKYFFSFYAIIDLLVLVPFYFFIITGEQTDWMRILRILRLVRITAYMHSDNIMLEAFKNKSLELKISLELFSFLVILIAVVFFFIEHSAQPENVTSVLSAFNWALSKVIRGIGGYGDFSPVTLPGKILATLLGILLIGLFAIPAGVLASGFVDEISKQKKRAKGKEILNNLREAFQHENITAHIRAKERYGIGGVRKYLSLADAGTKLYIGVEELLTAIKNGDSFRLKNYRLNQIEHTVIEHFEENAPYGVFLRRAASITVVSTQSGDQAFIGHFSARLAETLNAGYISAERYSANSLRAAFRLNVGENPGYVTESDDSSPVFTAFKEDLGAAVTSGSLVICFRESEDISEDGIHILNRGGAKQSTGKEGELCDPAFLASFTGDLASRAASLPLQVMSHDLAGDNPEGIESFLRRRLGAEVLCLHISLSTLCGTPDLYYGAVRALADAVIATRGGGKLFSAGRGKASTPAGA